MWSRTQQDPERRKKNFFFSFFGKSTFSLQVVQLFFSLVSISLVRKKQKDNKKLRDDEPKMIKDHDRDDMEAKEAEQSTPLASANVVKPGDLVLVCKPFVAVLDRKWKFQVSPTK